MIRKVAISIAASMSVVLPAISNSATPFYAEAVLSFVQGSGQAHPNFNDPGSALGAPDYADAVNTGFGIGAVSLGSGGSLDVRMSTGFTVGGTGTPDLVIYEIGPSQGGTAERVNVFISKNGTDWSGVGVAAGGTSYINIDGLGFTSEDVFNYVRVADLSANRGQPSGADIDSISALNPVPEPATISLLIFGMAIVLAKAARRSTTKQTEA